MKQCLNALNIQINVYLLGSTPTTTIKTTTQSQSPTLSPADAATAAAKIDNLLAQIPGLADKILAFPDQFMVTGFIDGKNKLENILNQFKQDIPAISLAQVDAITNMAGDFASILDKFIAGNDKY